MSSVNGEGEAPRSSWQRPDAPLGTLIFREGLLSAEQLEDALGESVKRGKRLGQVLVERGLLEEAQVARILARQKGLDYVDLSQTAVDPGRSVSPQPRDRLADPRHADRGGRRNSPRRRRGLR